MDLVGNLSAKVANNAKLALVVIIVLIILVIYMVVYYRGIGDFQPIYSCETHPKVDQLVEFINA